ncbi:DNA binding, excisionase family domain protein [Anoxybacillus sp. B7M1]|jgi:putative molybdopterin biosynthesis protein|uniref:Helix-turn-helix transcriptional regulator n=1 Tax=Anoxybacteroides rupiense TaxID=311460 RepID=A0ABD5ISK3_9BACL|nr:MULTISPECIES: helix-turn-helix transcriptional regulator [Anoxybacillus]ANB57654.1 DNA binding, excisionase family domain protein [Anoxybacillus sp. B2M1]ANB64316.1 DNA binding, excisionase family domain protein [Anoxybacillus sp. B7M1]KXG08950.1 putative DNA-binding proteinA [Anoxybacillus sp. P3H1B]MBB3908153.1 putative molybdopterin biosynthesis protein [Anoxybacillus rupiensis]MBS2773092.1 helix-turn-helix transcriptional regulator [Anoxybacillus rupiensis]
MEKNHSYTTEEVANILKVSKLTVYDLVKKGRLPAYRVGRQMRIDPSDLEEYIKRSKGKLQPFHHKETTSDTQEYLQVRRLVISGQDISLDILANYLEKSSKKFRPLRSYTGSLESLISMYQGYSDIVSTHLIEGVSGEYNVPYINKILVNFQYIVIRLLARRAGFYVKKGNPLNIKHWEDLRKKDIKMVNREKGAGARVLLDESLKKYRIPVSGINGYDDEVTNHVSVASAVAKGRADVGVGIERGANLVKEVDFIPLVNEKYDLVILKNEENRELISQVLQILSSDSFRNDLEALGGYDLSQTGQVVYET